VITGIWLLADGAVRLRALDETRLRHSSRPDAEPIDPWADRAELSRLYSRVRHLRSTGSPSFLWVDVVDPDEAELAKLGDVFGLTRLYLEDALRPRQRPKLELGDGDVFLVLRSLTFAPETSEVETQQVSAFNGPGYLLTITHGRTDIADSVAERVEREPALLRLGSATGLYALLDVVVDQYLAIAEEIGADIEEIEESVFSPARTDDAARIYLLKRENLELRRAVGPLARTAQQIARGGMAQIPDDLRPYLEDVADHVLRAAEYADANDQLLMTMLMASTARQDLQQNADMRRISAYVAIAAVPTLIAGIYGMNFIYMPELDEWWGYPFALGLMGLICFGLYRLFKRSGWL